RFIQQQHVRFEHQGADQTHPLALPALDPMVRATLQTELKALFEHLRQTVVLVTHELAEAAYLGHRLVLLQQGRVVQSGSFAQLRDQPAEPFVAEFINAQRRLELE
ncbi:MAG TPA: hypothetical protein VNZ22_22440, partial [Bacillota bacterium]|nr:hypothetical protein [Bacillota bacterium]